MHPGTVLTAGAAERDIDAPLAHYRAHGWARLGPTLHTDALELLRARADAIMRGEVVYPGLFFQHDAATGRYDEIPRGRGYQGPSLRYRKIEKLEQDPLFRAALENPLFGRIAQAVCGPAIALCRTVLFTKAAQGGTALPWHQDGGSFWGLSRDPELQIWTALDDVPAAAGGVELIPDSHAQGLATPLGGVIPDDVVARSGLLPRSVTIEARAGESLLLHNHVWHRSGTNATPHPRRALTVCFMDAAIHCTRRRSPRSFLRVFQTDPREA